MTKSSIVAFIDKIEWPDYSESFFSIAIFKLDQIYSIIIVYINTYVGWLWINFINLANQFMM